MKKLIFGAWNICTSWIIVLPQDVSSRRTALIACEFSCYSINTAALSEIRLAEEENYTFFWKCKAETEDRVLRVGLAVGMSKRLLKLLILLSPTRHTTIISTYMLIPSHTPMTQGTVLFMRISMDRSRLSQQLTR